MPLVADASDRARRSSLSEGALPSAQEPPLAASLPARFAVDGPAAVEVAVEQSSLTRSPASSSLSTASSPASSAHASPRRPPARFASTSFYTAGQSNGSSGSGGQDVRPPRRKRISPGASPTMSPAHSRRASQEDVKARVPTALEVAPIPRLETTSPSPVRSPTVPPVSSSLLPLPRQTAGPSSPASPSSPSDGGSALPATAKAALTKHQLRRPGANSFNSRREASGRPTLASMTAASIASGGGSPVAESEAISALRLNLDILGRPKYDHATKTFVSDGKPAPYTMSGHGGAKSPMIRKKSGELVRPALKMTLTPSYDANPLSAASNASAASSAGSSPFVGSRSLPATPSFPKIVHFDTQLEVRDAFAFSSVADTAADPPGCSLARSTLPL